jgi:Putative prokaryotic signal transducing protein
VPQANPKELVIVAECGSNMEASMLRAALEASGIFCYVQGENHRSLLGPLGPYVALNLMVRREDLADARALVDEHRQQAEAALTPETPEDRDADAEAVRAAMRRRARLLAIFPSFGSGHHRAGAHLRGLVFGAVETFGFYELMRGRAAFGLVLVFFAIVTDFISVGAVIDGARPPR